MESYELILKPSIERDLRNFPKDIVDRVWKRLGYLVSEPFPPGVVKLSGAERLYRVRVGDYRIVYEVDKVARKIIIHYIRHRRQVYRKL